MTWWSPGRSFSYCRSLSPVVVSECTIGNNIWWHGSWYLVSLCTSAGFLVSVIGEINPLREFFLCSYVQPRLPLAEHSRIVFRGFTLLGWECGVPGIVSCLFMVCPESYWGYISWFRSRLATRSGFSKCGRQRQVNTVCKGQDVRLNAGYELCRKVRLVYAPFLQCLPLSTFA
jgi:hypothetical protein